MRKMAAVCSLGFLACACFAQVGKAHLRAFNEKLLQAQSLAVDYTIEPVGGAPEDYNIRLSKPNFVRITAPWESVIADGKTITTFDFLGKTFYRMPDTVDNLISVFSDLNLNLWAGFFDSNAMENVPEALLLPPKVIAGQQLTPLKVTMDTMGEKVETLYFDSTDMPRKAELDVTSQNSTKLLNASRIELGNSPLDSSSFAFNIPTGAQELTREEVVASHWFDNMHDATQEATASKKNVFLVFTSTKSAPCTRMENELFPLAAFKRQSKFFVFCNVDVDTSKRMVKTYAVTGSPTVFIVNTKGQRLAQVAGYSGPPAILALMNANHPVVMPGG